MTEVAELMIRETTPADLQDILYVEHEAFKRDSEPKITKDMLIDPSAEPRLSLIGIHRKPTSWTYPVYSRNPHKQPQKLKFHFLHPWQLYLNFKSKESAAH